MASTTLTTSFSLLRRYRSFRGHAVAKSLPNLSFARLPGQSPALLRSCRGCRHSGRKGCRFDKIIAKEIPSTIVYEDEKVLAFRDVNPQAPVHVLVIPKIKDGLTQLGKAEPRHAEILGHLLYAAKVVAEKEGIVDGFRVVINSGPQACQSVYHLHLHVLGGRQLKWPAG